MASVDRKLVACELCTCVHAYILHIMLACGRKRVWLRGCGGEADAGVTVTVLMMIG